MAGTVNPTTHDRVSDGEVWDAGVSGRRPPWFRYQYRCRYACGYRDATRSRRVMRRH